MITNIIGQTISGVSATAARFMGVYSLGTTPNASASGTSARNVMPCAGTLKNFIVAYDTTAGGGFTRTFEIYKNNAATGVSITVPDGSVSGSDLVNTISFVAGDTISVRTVASGVTSSTGVIRWSIGADCAANVSMILGGPSGQMGGLNTVYSALSGYDGNTTAGTSSEQVIPTAGTIKNAYMWLSSNAGATYTATLYLNGAPTSLIIAIAGAASTGNDLNILHSVAVVAGDKVYWQIVPVGAPNAAFCYMGVEFDPTVDGESIHMFGGAANMVNSSVRYQGVASYNAAFVTTDAARSAITQGAVWKKLYVYVPTVTGAAKTWQFQLNVATVAGNPSVTIGNASTTGNDSTNSTSSNLGDTISMKVTPTSSPTASLAEWGIVSYIAPSVQHRMFACF